MKIVLSRTFLNSSTSSAHVTSLAVGDLGSPILLETRQRVVEASREPECPVKKQAFAIA
jgi:hypothetical protein